MPIQKPYHRVCRPFLSGSFSGNYLYHKKYANDPQHYIRAFLLLQQDLENLFAYIEPSDVNLETYSHRIQQLLMRACVEVEANLTAILIENGYKKSPKDFTMWDYKLVNQSHKLSSYEARIPGWYGSLSTHEPFKNWETDIALPWYRAYNESKHDRQNNFNKATFEALLDSMSGLVILITAQFYNVDYKPGPIGLATHHQGFDSDDGMISATGGLFRVKMPTGWPEDERYDFDWRALCGSENPFDQFDFNALK